MKVLNPSGTDLPLQYGGVYFTIPAGTSEQPEGVAIHARRKYAARGVRCIHEVPAPEAPAPVADDPLAGLVSAPVSEPEVAPEAVAPPDPPAGDETADQASAEPPQEDAKE